MAVLTNPEDLDEVLLLADQSGLGLIMVGDDLSVVLANETAHLALDRPHGWLIGRTSMEAFLDHRVEELLKAAVAGESGSYETSRGEQVQLIVRARKGAGEGAWASLQNVTELRRLQRVRSDFFDNVSHELRTPLASIRLLTEMLLDELGGIDVPDRVRERVATIDVESGHLAQLIDELLDLARMEQDDSEIRHDAVALPELIATAITRLQTFADRQSVGLLLQAPVDLPAVRGDEERIATLFRNLLHNAIKFSSLGGTVTVTADEHPDSVVVSVADEGVGIPAADQQRVFDRFYKVDRARHRGQGGTGLGLAIAQDIVIAHGGQIWLESREGEGSTFGVSLPLA